MPRAVPLFLVVVTAVALPASARAQFVDDEVCAGVALRLAKPAAAEWSEWIGVAGGWGSLGSPGEHADLLVRVGGGVDFELAQAGNPQQYGGPVELRMGPWIQADGTFGESPRDPSVALEGGLSFDLGQTSHAQWGDYALRVGAGAIASASGWRPSGSLTIAWGVRSVLDRYVEGGACVGADGGFDSVFEGRPRSDHALASGIRVFATARVDGDAVYSLVIGFELEPTFLFPPYSLPRWIGAPP